MTSEPTLALLADATRRMEDMRTHITALADKRTDWVRVLREDGMTYSDIAREIDVTPQAVAKMARRRTDG